MCLLLKWGRETESERASEREREKQQVTRPHVKQTHPRVLPILCGNTSIRMYVFCLGDLVHALVNIRQDGDSTFHHQDGAK